VQGNARIVDGNVDAAEPPNGFRDLSFALKGIGNVRLKRVRRATGLCNGGCRSFRAVTITVCTQDRCALAGKPPCNGGADPAASTGNQCRLSLQSHRSTHAPYRNDKNPQKISVREGRRPHRPKQSRPYFLDLPKFDELVALFRAQQEIAIIF
jgi:hypothetical protein